MTIRLRPTPAARSRRARSACRARAASVSMAAAASGRVEPHRMAAHLLERQRRGEEAECGCGAGRRRDQHLAHPEHAGDPAPHAPVRRRRSRPWRSARGSFPFSTIWMRAPPAMLSVTTRWMPQAVSIARQAEPRADALPARARPRRGRAPCGRRGRSRDRNSRAAGWHRSPSARCRRGRSRPGPGSAPAECGPDAQQPDLVDRGDRAAAGADLDHVDDRRLDRQARTLLEAVHARGFHLGGDMARVRPRSGRLSPSCRPCRS